MINLAELQRSCEQMGKMFLGPIIRSWWIQQRKKFLPIHWLSRRGALLSWSGHVPAWALDFSHSLSSCRLWLHRIARSRLSWTIWLLWHPIQPFLLHLNLQLSWPLWFIARSPKLPAHMGVRTVAKCAAPFWLFALYLLKYGLLLSPQRTQR